MTKPTPGPWHQDGRHIKAACRDKPIAEVPMYGVQRSKVDDANARLIAAAPRLLAACERGAVALQIFLEELVTDPEDDDQEALDAMLAAIAEAAGGRP